MTEIEKGKKGHVADWKRGVEREKNNGGGARNKENTAKEWRYVKGKNLCFYWC